MKKTSIGTWAYNVGPYGESPIPFDTVGKTLSELKFDGLELGGFNGYPNPGNHPEKEHRDGLKEKMTNWGLSFSGFAQDLWSEQLLNTDDQSKYISAFKSNVDFAVDLGIKGVRVDCVQPPPGLFCFKNKMLSIFINNQILFLFVLFCESIRGHSCI